MRISIGRLLPVLFLALLPAAGCEPTVSREELGTVVFEVPKVAGADTPYLMPELGPPLPDAQRTHRNDLDDEDPQAAIEK